MTKIVNARYRPLGRSLSDAPPAKVVITAPQYLPLLTSSTGRYCGAVCELARWRCQLGPLSVLAGKNADWESTIPGISNDGAVVEHRFIVMNAEGVRQGWLSPEKALPPTRPAQKTSVGITRTRGLDTA